MGKKRTPSRCKMPGRLSDEIWRMVDQFGAEHPERISLEHDRIDQLKTALDMFLERSRAQHHKAHFSASEFHVPKEKTLRRALLLVQDNIGGTLPTLNLLTLFATRGEKRYEEYIDENFFSDRARYLPKASATLVVREYEVPADQSPKSPEILSAPEFPPKPFYQPRFPATRTLPLHVPGFNEVWLKDESTNPTGTHKDRMAHEIRIQAERFHDKFGRFLTYSMISAGSAASAIQFMFRLYNIETHLKVIVDKSTGKDEIAALERIGCEVTLYDLGSEMLMPSAVKEITSNSDPEGQDISRRSEMDPSYTHYYDWLSYEILNQTPDFCFVPFGTGDLFVNIIRVLSDEIRASYAARVRDSRFHGNLRALRKCHFLGATADGPSSRLTKLFAHFLPDKEGYKQYLESLVADGSVGQESRIVEVDDSYVNAAYRILDHNNQMRRDHQIGFEDSSIAGLALFLQLKDELNIRSEDKVLIVNTGTTKYSADPDAVKSGTGSRL